MEHQFHKLQGSNEEAEEEKLWDKWVDEEYPDTFSFLELAKDGGFSEVKGLYYPSRWISSALLIIFVVYNVEAVISLDYDLTFAKTDEPAKNDIGVEDMDEIENRFYISTPMVSWLWKAIGNDDAPPVPTKILGALELSWLTFHMFNVLYCLLMIKIDEGFKRWYHVQYVFWDVLPVLSTYSAMKLLNAIVPTVFLSQLFEKIGIIQEAIAEQKSKVKPILSLVWWLIAAVFSFIIGFDTFLMKLRVVSSCAQKDTEGIKTLTKIVLPVLQFLIQVLGVVQLGPFVRKRLFVFIFGGEDGILQDEEVELMVTWNALLAKRMYRDLTWWEFIAVMTSFSDEDFQSLVLNEDAAKKEQEIGH